MSIAIFRAVAIARGPGDSLNGLGALEFLQLGKFLLKPFQPLRSDIILGPSRKRGDLAFEILVCIELFGKGFAHGAK